MVEREATWAEVTVGTVIQDPKLTHWLVLDEAADVNTGAPLVQIINSRRDKMWVPRREPTAGVILLEATEEEAISNAKAGFSGTTILKRQNDQTLPRRCARYVMAPINTKGRGARDRIRDHIDAFHGVYVNDRWSDKTNPKTTAELVEAHGDMHTLETLAMAIPHTHEEETR